MSDDDRLALKDKIIVNLQTVYDPEIPVDIYKLGLIYDIEVSDESNAKIQMTLTSPNCPAAQTLPAYGETKTRETEGVNSVDVVVVFEPAWTPELMEDSAKLELNIL